MANFFTMLRLILVVSTILLFSCERKTATEPLLIIVDSTTSISDSVLQHNRNDLLIWLVNTWQGTRYSPGGNSMLGVDNYNFINAILRNSYRDTIPSDSARQANAWVLISLKDAAIGDLVLFKKRNRLTVSNIGLYLGDSAFTYADVNRGVVTSHISDEVDSF